MTGDWNVFTRSIAAANPSSGGPTGRGFDVTGDRNIGNSLVRNTPSGNTWTGNHFGTSDPPAPSCIE